MGGGPSTPALAVAVSEAGGLGFLAAGYRTPEAVRREVEELRALTARPFGVNLFAPPGAPGRSGRARALRRRAGRARPGATASRSASRGTTTTTGPRSSRSPRSCGSRSSRSRSAAPSAAAVRSLQAAGCAVWVTVTTPAEARAAARPAPTRWWSQGAEAGGHRGSFDDAAPGDIGLLALLQLVQAESELPLVATGGIATGRGVAAVLAAGAAAAQLGSAFMLAPEAATAPSHREALAGPPRPRSRAPSPAAPRAASSTASWPSTKARARTRRSTT